MVTETIDQGTAFAITMLITAIGLFVLSLLMKSRAVGHAARKSAEIMRMTRELETVCTDLAARCTDRGKELKKREAEHKAIAMEIMQIQKTIATAAADSFQVIHEIGTPDAGARSFDIEIVLSEQAMTEGAVKVNPKLWAVRNVAQVWAPDEREAVRAAGRAFPSRYGFVVTRVLTDAAGAATAVERT